MDPSIEFNISNLNVYQKGLLSQLFGVVLCGGQSSRMGTNKALINYNGKPQYLYAASLLMTICPNVYISVKKEQIAAYNYPNIITDIHNYHGPINGLLSAFEKTSGPILLIGVDYPKLKLEDLYLLLKTKKENHDVVCYCHEQENIVEPLVAIYDGRCKRLLETYIKKENNPSLQKFIKEVNAHKINLIKPHNIISFDVNTQN
jgi:molybdenum cofactor guanylyltransferase